MRSANASRPIQALFILLLLLSVALKLVAAFMTRFSKADAPCLTAYRNES